MSIKKNDVIKLEITSTTSEGQGIGKYNGLTIFVPAAVEGDMLEVKILKVQKNYAFGKIENIITQSDKRILSDCELFLKCGGCSLRHVPYNVELEIKKNKVQDAINRIGGFKSIKVDEIIASKNYNHYRNKAQIPIRLSKDENVSMGFFAPHSHRVINCDNCLLHPELFNKVICIFKQWINKYKPSIYDEMSHKGKIRHLYIRYAEKTQELMVCVVINGKELEHQDKLVNMLKTEICELKSVILNYNVKETNVILGNKCRTIYGDDYIVDELCGLKFRISPLSFYQVNRTQAEVLYSIAAQYANLKDNDTLLDLYCGTGTIGLTMAKKVKKLIGVECIAQAIEDAKANAKLNNITNAEFICADASSAAKIMLKDGINADVVVIDPPRKGCDVELIKTIVGINPNRLIYISCDPATLARDLKIFNEYLYTPIKITPVDMFPRTSHVETVVLLSKSQ